jgi:hypothetical protein
LKTKEYTIVGDLIMATRITNISGNDYSVDNYVWEKNETKVIEGSISKELIDELALGKNLVSDSDFTPFNELDALDNDLATITDSSTGTAATETEGALTVAAVTDVASAANAIATLVAEIEKQRVLNDALVAHIGAIEAECAKLRTEISVIADK